MCDENMPQNEHEELSEQELDEVSGGFNPQPDPPRAYRWADLPEPDIFPVSKIGSQQQDY